MARTLTPEMRAAINAAATKASDQAVKKTLLSLGIDATTAEGIRSTQQDSAFVRRTRLAVETRSTKWVLGAISTFLSIVGGAVVVLFQAFLGR